MERKSGHIRQAVGIFTEAGLRGGKAKGVEMRKTAGKLRKI